MDSIFNSAIFVLIYIFFNPYEHITLPYEEKEGYIWAEDW